MGEIVIITQARLGSTRFPEKILKKVNGKTLIEIHIDRLKKSKYAKNLVVATTFEYNIEKLIGIIEKLNVSLFQGDENDVLDRFYKASLKFNNIDYVVRVTSDCPLIDSRLLDKIVNIAKNKNLDYCSNTLVETFPDGQDIEVIKWQSLKQCWLEAKLKSDREHVTPFIKRNSTFFKKNKFVSENLKSEIDYSSIRMTVDKEIDLPPIMILEKQFGFDESWETYANYIMNNKSKFKNQNIQRNEGYLKSIENDF